MPVPTTVLLLATLLAAPAAAEPDGTLFAAAQRLYERGVSQFKDGDYEASARSFSAALELADRPSLHYNLACSFEKLGRTVDALAEYRAYLSGDPEAKDRAEVRSILRRLEQETQTDQRAAVAKPEPPPSAPPMPALEPASAGDAASSAWAPPPPAPASRLPAYLAWAAAGAAALTAGWFAVQASGAADRFESATVSGDTPYERTRVSGLRGEAESAALVADVVAVTALAAAGTGVWLFLRAEPSGAGTLGWRF